MRYPKTHKFLAWAGPTIFVFTGGCLGLLATFAQTYDGVKNWSQKLFDQWWPIMSAPWFFGFGGVVICAYIGATIYTGGNKRTLATGALIEPDAPRREILVDQIIAAKGKSIEAAIDHRLSLGSWTPLDETIRYLACQSAWGAAHNPDDPLIPIHVGQALQDTLLCGDLRARGRRFHVLRGGIKDPPLHPLEPIPPDFWRDARLDAYWPLQGRVQMIASHGAENVARKGDHEGMHDIRLDQRQVEALWPRKEVSFEQAFKEEAADRIPFIRLRDIAKENDLDFDHRVPGATNLAYALEGALRQAAVDGTLKAWGRKYRGLIKSNDPLVLIPAAHFEDYEFGHGNLHYETANPMTRTNTIQMAAREQDGIEGVTYYDLQLSLQDARAVVRQFSRERPSQ